MKKNMVLILIFFFVYLTGTAQTLRIGIISGCEEYDSDASLKLLQKQLGDNYDVRIFWMQGTDYRASGDLPEGFDEWLYHEILPHDLERIEYLDSIDVLLLFAGRLILSKEKMEKVKAFTRSGVPIIGIRNATAAFLLWLDFAPMVLGGEYFDHYKPASLKFKFKIIPDALEHSIVRGFKPWVSHNLYKHSNLGPATELLMEGRLLNGSGSREAVSWTNLYNNTRMFYISLGTPDDFAREDFRNCLVNAIAWATKGGLKKKMTNK